ncbi:hypothetical protein GZH47_21815 [Paenibacillus rhizovicinus]|uniref:Uncharacterized protein n=1 Tax=Paenibacillus rhizovicinus TaxID=2704463 RepID=A0A6C0P3R9_9BACL|nr:hypothetical protein [Paenibacillus rhizovicinus]QHW33158.1 hypothetical protein GZH47_21815 [Paenibacillus rhizovicinus]
MPKLRPLLTHADFERMRIFTRPIDVWQDGQLVDRAVIIQAHDETNVTSDANKQYEKSAFQFFYGSHL